MAYCAYLDPDAISEEIFLESYPDKEKLKKVVNLLSNLSLIKKQAESLFSIHRLVQLVIRNEKEATENQQYEEVFSCLVPAFVTFFEKNIYTSAQISKLLNNFHHILRLLEHSWRLKRSSQEDKALEHLELLGKILFTTLTLGDNSRFFTSSQESKTNKSQGKKIKEKKDLYSKKSWLIFRNSKENDGFPIWLTNLAQVAHPSIQFVLAILYTRDFVVNRNDERVVYWYRKAAEQGHVLAQTNLGVFLLDTIGEPQNYKEAFEWLTLGAEQGDPDAYQGLANIYANALGVEKDDEMAFYWSMEAAKKKKIESKANVGVMYFEGRGIEKNINEAIAYLTEAAEQGHDGAQFYLGMVYYNGEEVEKDDNKAIEWLTKSAEQEFAESQFLLGKIYCEDAGRKGTCKEGIQWLTKAVEQGYKDAQWLLSFYLLIEEKREALQEQLSLTSEVKEEESVTEVVQQTYDSNEYTLQGDAYMAEAIKNFEEGDTALAEYFTELANESYSLAEDIKLATMLQE
jgi:TPR repeat protein